LALVISATRRTTEDHRGDSRSDPTLGARESGMGSPEDPRRASETRPRRFGAEYGAVSATHAPSRGEPAKRWLTFLQNHREVIAAFDFFTVPTVTFRMLYCFFVIEHGRRRILHFNVTYHPTAKWSSNNCAKLSPKRVHIDMPSSIEIPHSMTKWSPS